MATVVGVSYAAVVNRAFGRRAKRNGLYVDPTTFPYVFADDYALTSEQIVDLIRGFGFRVRVRHDFDFGEKRAILTCSIGSEEYHCIVWDPVRRRFIDPASPTLARKSTYLGQWKRADRETFIVSPQ